jgi:DNA-binding response OmpR family regulator
VNLPNFIKSGLQPLQWGLFPWPMENGYMDTTPLVARKENPRVVLVDDDPVFCKAVKRCAKKLNVDVTVCKNLSEFTKSTRESTFDVAVLDYFLGELTAFQLAHLLDGNVPVVLISNTEARRVSGDAWPAEVRSFVHKSRGVNAILAEAMLTARWGQRVSGGTSAVTNDAELESDRDDMWWLSIVVPLATGLVLWLLYFFSPKILPDRIWQWDRGVDSTIEHTTQEEAASQVPKSIVAAPGPARQNKNSVQRKKGTGKTSGWRYEIWRWDQAPINVAPTNI